MLSSSNCCLVEAIIINNHKWASLRLRNNYQRKNIFNSLKRNLVKQFQNPGHYQKMKRLFFTASCCYSCTDFGWRPIVLGKINEVKIFLTPVLITIKKRCIIPGEHKFFHYRFMLFPLIFWPALSPLNCIWHIHWKIGHKGNNNKNIKR